MAVEEELGAPTHKQTATYSLTEQAITVAGRLTRRERRGFRGGAACGGAGRGQAGPMSSFAPVPIATAPGLPLVGNLFDIRRDRLGLHMRCVMNADITKLKLAWRRAWVIGASPLAHQVLVEDADAFVKAPGLAAFGRPLLGRGLLTADGDDHRRQRKLMAPAFAPKRMAGYADVMAGRAAIAADHLRPGATIDLSEEMMALTLDIVGRTLFDVDLAGEARAVADALTVAMEYIISSITAPLPYSWPLPRNRKLRAAIARLDEIVLRIIADRRTRTADRGDVLSILLEAKDDDGSGLSDRELRDEIMTLMLAGHETTANLLAWTWAELARTPDVRERLEVELDTVLGERAPTYADLPRLPYTLAILEESLRLYPPAYVVAREAKRALTIGEAKIEPRDVVLVAIRAMQRRPDYWPDPDRFDPTRFLGDSAGARGRRVGYLPFGAGPRVCIGNHFALAEAQLILATWAQRFRFRLVRPGPIDPEPLVTLRPLGGVHVVVEPRAPRPDRVASRPQGPQLVE